MNLALIEYEAQIDTINNLTLELKKANIRLDRTVQNLKKSVLVEKIGKSFTYRMTNAIGKVILYKTGRDNGHYKYRANSKKRGVYIINPKTKKHEKLWAQDYDIETARIRHALNLILGGCDD